MTNWQIINIPGLTNLLPRQYSLWMDVTGISSRSSRSGRQHTSGESFHIMIRSNKNVQEPRLAFALFKFTSDYIDRNAPEDPTYRDEDKEIYLSFLGSHISGVGLGHFLMYCVSVIAKRYFPIEQQARRMVIGLSDETGTIGEKNNIYIKLGCQPVDEANDLSCNVNDVLKTFDTFIDTYLNKGFFVDNITKTQISLMTKKKILKLRIQSPKYYPGFKKMPITKDVPEDLSIDEIRKLIEDYKLDN